MSDQMNDNQTIFSEEQPFFDVDSFGKNFIDPSVPKKKRSPLIFIIIIVILVILVGILTLMRLFQNSGGIISPFASPTPTPVTSLSPLDQLFIELDNEIKNADPSENILPFPPVRDTITISPEK